MTLLAAAGIYWHLPVLIILVSFVYSATRFDDWDRIIHYATRGMVYIVVFMGTVFLVLTLLGQLV